MTLKALTLLLALSGSALHAQTVQVTDAWVRSTMAGQQATGAFMTLTSKEGATLVGVKTPISGVAEVHEMKMDGDIMRMRAVQGGLDLPAGKAVVLKPGGYHLMLMDLKAPLPKGTTVSVTLIFREAGGKQSELEINMPAALSAPSGSAADHPSHGGAKH